MVLHPEYDGPACDCSAVFGETLLHGKVQDEITSVAYYFPSAFRSAFLATSSSEASNASSTLLVPALLRPWSASTMILDVGPGVCAYQ